MLSDIMPNELIKPYLFMNSKMVMKNKHALFFEIEEKIWRINLLGWGLAWENLKSLVVDMNKWEDKKITYLAIEEKIRRFRKENEWIVPLFITNERYYVY